jgi:YhcH/YjgK/YiaL family protein
MIYDRFDLIDRYALLIPGLPGVLTALRMRGPLDVLPAGRQTLLPGKADLIIDRYTPSPDRPVVWETHRRFADIQLVLAGEERFGWLPASAAPPEKDAYDAERDACFYQPPSPMHAPPPCYLPLRVGDFAVFLPEDVHAPGLVPKGQAVTAAEVTKAVVKVRLDQ